MPKYTSKAAIKLLVSTLLQALKPEADQIKFIHFKF